MTSPANARLPKHTKFAYGIGQVAEAVKTRGFDVLVFFYFTQVLGLSGTLAGMALLIALVIDAISDPIMGMISDSWRSPRGRRHPFMYASALPLGIFWCLLFIPPSGLSQTGLFFWLLVFAVLVRQAMTVYQLPHLALGAGLTDDYHERTSVVAWRTASGVVGAIGVILVAIQIFLPETPEFENGMMNPTGYPKIALFTGIIMSATIWWSAWGTRDRIPYLPQASPERQSLRDYLKDIGVAFSNPSFLALFFGFSMFAVSNGVQQTLGTHISVFFWQFDSQEIALLGFTFIIGFFPGVALTRPLHARFDKKLTMIVSASVSALLINIAILLRLADLAPANETPALFWLIFALLVGLAIVAGVSLTTAGSMMADVAQEHMYRTGKSQQGVLFSAISFSGKAGSGLGHAVGGFGIDLIRFPLQSAPSAVAPDSIYSLGMLSLASSIIGVIGLAGYFFYRLDRSRHEETRALLDGRAPEPAAVPPARGVSGVASGGHA
jgi:GPH family glycoside/pentoside/hexuronide:cation symporter